MPYLLIFILSIIVVASLSYIVGINDKLKQFGPVGFLAGVLVFIYLTPIMFLALLLISYLFYTIGKKQRESKGK